MQIISNLLSEENRDKWEEAQLVQMGWGNLLVWKRGAGGSVGMDKCQLIQTELSWFGWAPQLIQRGVQLGGKGAGPALSMVLSALDIGSCPCSTDPGPSPAVGKA